MIFYINASVWLNLEVSLLLFQESRMRSSKKYSVVSDFDGLYSSIQPYYP